MATSKTSSFHAPWAARRQTGSHEIACAARRPHPRSKRLAVSTLSALVVAAWPHCAQAESSSRSPADEPPREGRSGTADGKSAPAGAESQAQPEANADPPDHQNSQISERTRSASVSSEPPLLPGLSPNSLGALSVGHPHEGFLLNAVRMPEGKYWTVALPQYAYGTEETIAALMHCIARVNEQHENTPKVIIGSISKQGGGRFPPHKSHQSGRDADVGFYYNPGYPVAKPATRENLDVERTWTLVKTFITETDVDMILIDKSVQHLLEVHALRRGEDPAWLKSVFHGNGSPYSSLIKHVPGHQAHMHVRFSSPIARQRGKSSYQTLVAQGHIELAQSEVKHHVKRGDTLIGIAKTHETSVATIQKLNQLSTTKIRVGQTLLIRAPRHLRGAYDPIVVPTRRLPAGHAPRRAALTPKSGQSTR